LHLLGFGDTDFILHYRPKSYDIVTWQCGRRFGEMRVRHCGDFSFNADEKISINYLKRMGIQEKDFDKVNSLLHRRCKGVRENIQSAVMAGDTLKRMAKLQTIGVTEYSVCIGLHQLKFLSDAYSYFIDKKEIDIFTKIEREAK
jgi:hypothetical protein